jgi:hypothetical protein
MSGFALLKSGLPSSGERGGVARGQIGIAEGRGIEVGDDVEEKFAAKKIDGAVDGESWFLETFSSIPHDTESLWLPSFM